MATTEPVTSSKADAYEAEVEKSESPIRHDSDASLPTADGDLPTEEELRVLHREPGPIPWTAYTIAFVELCERFSYYGTIVVFQNFIQQPLPKNGNRAGAGHEGQSGALGQGQRAATGLTTFNQFWVYVVPLFGAYMADEHWGRYKTICVSIGVAILGHILLVCCAIPDLIAKPTSALGLFSVAIIIMGLGTGGFKPNISPLVAEQCKVTAMQVKTKKNGRRFIVDPTLTASRIYMYFYLFINIGALVGQVGMVYAEKYVGFWLAYLLPTIVFFLCPLVMVWGRKRYKRTPPQGSVFAKAMNLWFLGLKKTGFKKSLGKGSEAFWQSVKPSNIPAAERPHWMTFDDLWVDEVRRGFKACSVFLYFPLYWLTYNQLNNNLTSQAATMELHGLPNDILSNLNPFSLMILIPICDLLIYPSLRKAGINFTPIKKITLGFFCGSAAMIWAAVIQAYIYKRSECGKYAAGTLADGETPCPTVDINVWAQSGSYILIAISEIFASITGLEYAFTKAPRNMRSLVMAVFLFQSGLSSAIGTAFVSLSADPLLVWNYGVMAVASAIGGTCFWFQYRKLDKMEDVLNMQGTGHFAPHEGEEPGAVLTTEGPGQLVEKETTGVADQRTGERTEGQV